jgi:hypothetical protein
LNGVHRGYARVVHFGCGSLHPREQSTDALEIRRVGGVERATRKGRRMAPESSDAVDLTELAELIEDEDTETPDAEPATPVVRATAAPGEIAVA